jgi:Flavodoxin domain
VMRTLIVYESMYGNTREIAEAIAAGVGADAEVRSVHDAGRPAAGVGLLVVGGPTHMHGLSSGRTRRMAADAAAEDGREPEPSATQGPGLRAWLHALERGAGPSAAFDTRLDRSPYLTGSAARGIARRLRHHGYDVVETESFLVDDAEGPVSDGEIDRARAWGASLAARLSPASGARV